MQPVSAAGNPVIRLLLADDHPVVRRGLAACLGKLPGVEIVGEAVNGQEAVRKAKELLPDLVLLDLEMPRMNGFEAAEALRQQAPGIKVLVLSMFRHADYVARSIQAGARGFVVKDAPTEELIQAISAVHAGQTYFSAEIAAVALHQVVRGPEGRDGTRLTRREQEVLVRVAEGLSNKEIATRLGVGVRTVETHRARIMQKLDTHTIAGLTRYALFKGWAQA